MPPLLLLRHTRIGFIYRQTKGLIFKDVPQSNTRRPKSVFRSQIGGMYARGVVHCTRLGAPATNVAGCKHKQRKQVAGATAFLFPGAGAARHGTTSVPVLGVSEGNSGACGSGGER